MDEKHSTSQSNTASNLHSASTSITPLIRMNRETTWSASEPRRFDSVTPLSLFLDKLLRDNQLSIRDACRIAGISPSVLHGWLCGSYPIYTVVHLKKLANRFGYSLAEALTGSSDEI